MVSLINILNNKPENPFQNYDLAINNANMVNKSDKWVKFSLFDAGTVVLDEILGKN